MTFLSGYMVRYTLAKSGCPFTPKKVNSGIFILISYASEEGFGIDFNIDESIE